MPRKRAVHASLGAILWGGLIAGQIDITYALGYSAAHGASEAAPIAKSTRRSAVAERL
jgi:hypothetical protein